MKQTTLKLFVLSLFLLASGLFFIRGSHAQQQGDKPVEQTRKNIQVLKGMPSSQLGPVMDFISGSLGVDCTFCHVSTANSLIPEKDDKPEKLIARRMMQMQFDINKGNKDIFGTTGAISCYTCHRGQTKPQVMPKLPQPMIESGATGEKTEAAPLPTVDEILGKYVAAIGGKTAYEKGKSRVWKGVQIMSNGNQPQFELYQVAPNKYATILTTPKNGTFYAGYNGMMGWTKGPRGQRELMGRQLEEMKRAADFYSDVNLKVSYPDLTVVGKEKIGDREAYVLVSPINANRTDRLYFDTQTGLLLRILSVTRTMIGPVPEQTDFEDYRDVDGVKLPFVIRASFIDPADGWTRKFTEIKQNIPVDETKFNMPAPSPTPTQTQK